MDPLVNTELKEIKPLCAVCQEESAGFHFGAFTCEGCKSFFGRCTEDARVVISECKTGGNCNIKGRSRTSCKSCRLRKCQMVGMSRQSLDHQTTQPVIKQEDITQFSSSLFPSLPLAAQFSSQELHCPPQFSPTSVIKSTTSSAPSSSSNSAQIYKPVPLFPSPISPPSLQSFASALDSKIPQELQAYMAMWWPWASPASPTLSSSIPGSPSSTSSSLELTERGGGLRSGMEGLHIQQTEPLDLSVQQTEPLDLSMKPREKFSITGSRQESVLKFASHK